MAVAAGDTKPVQVAEATQDTSLPNIGASLIVKKELKPTGTSPDTNGLPMLGKADAKVSLVVFSDYECPFCNKFYMETMSELKKEYIDTGKVKFIFKNFPLYTIHKKAIPAAMAAKCAGDQGKYYEMHDALFDNFATWTRAVPLKNSFLQLADKIGLDKKSFESCIASEKFKPELEKEYTEGYYLGVRGTPTTYINGKAVTDEDGNSLGALPYEMLKERIDLALAGK